MCKFFFIKEIRFQMLQNKCLILQNEFLIFKNKFLISLFLFENELKSHM